jgi:hypothetical protein
MWRGNKLKSICVDTWNALKAQSKIFGHTKGIHLKRSVKKKVLSMTHFGLFDRKSWMLDFTVFALEKKVKKLKLYRINFILKYK